MTGYKNQACKYNNVAIKSEMLYISNVIYDQRTEQVSLLEAPTALGDDCSLPDGMTLWVERGFGRREIVPRMVAAVPTLRVISTMEQPIDGTSVLEDADLSTPAGISAMNERIDTHGIDALWLQNSAKYDLGGIACAVHVAATPEVIGLVDDKAKFAEWLGNDPLRADATEVLGAAGVAEEYARRRALGKDVCVKPVVGLNGHGYWHLNERAPVMLDKPELREIRPDIYVKAMELEERDREPQRLLVMDWLPGPEVSVDLLCWRGVGLIHAARTKSEENDMQRIQSEHPTIEHAYDVAGRLALHGVVSMQYRKDVDGAWKMLEVNPRPAGGSVNSEDAGFGIISEWARLVTGVVGPDDIAQRSGDVLVTFRRTAELKRIGA